MDMPSMIGISNTMPQTHEFDTNDFPDPDFGEPPSPPPEN